ncbi:hypothetical protein GQX74_003741 [Glossina fuscipes]|nr:hypothetical protein GQX74_003741 [Glossina fuscipes]
MKFTQYLAVNVLLVLLSLLTVLADSTTTASNNKQHTTLHHNHHHHQRQHLTHKLRHHMLANGGRQVKKLDLNSPQIYAATLTSRGVQRTSKDVETVDEGGVKNKPKNLTFTAASAAATRLRRISPRNYYNKVLQTHVNVRRHNNNNNVGNDWAYNSYNIFTNTFGAPVSSHAGKGDDNTDDVEFISASGNRQLPDWSRRSFGGAVPPIVPTRQPITTSTTTTTTMAPPVLVPARRGYNSITNSISGDSVTTEDPFESNSVHRNPGSIDPKEMESIIETRVRITSLCHYVDVESKCPDNKITSSSPNTDGTIWTKIKAGCTQRRRPINTIFKGAFEPTGYPIRNIMRGNVSRGGKMEAFWVLGLKMTSIWEKF